MAEGLGASSLWCHNVRTTSEPKKGAFSKMKLAIPPLFLKGLTEHKWTLGTLLFCSLAVFPSCSQLGLESLPSLPGEMLCLSRSYHTLNSCKDFPQPKYTDHISPVMSQRGAVLMEAQA